MEAHRYPADYEKVHALRSEGFEDSLDVEAQPLRWRRPASATLDMNRDSSKTCSMRWAGVSSR